MSELLAENARLRDELHRAHAAVQRSGGLAMLGTLAAGIAHEIRNPLVSVQTFFQLAPTRLHDEEFLTSFLQMTEGEVARVCDLVAELLALAKPPAAPVVEPVDLADLVQRTIRLLTPQARQRRVRLTATLTAGLPPVSGDSDRIKQVLLNIVLNAIEATETNGSVSVVTKPVRHESGPFCLIEVRDTGSGMPSEVCREIFTPFFTTKANGSGLGLAIAQQILAAHGGFLAVDSQLGVGSSFSIHLPAGYSALRATR